ncbi:MAG: hypothetical protein ACE5JS_04075 [Nitrospinota bacterium]
MHHRLRRVATGLGIAATAILITILFLEVAFRLFFPQGEYAIALAPWGYTHKANTKIYFHYHGRKIPIHYNSKGLRGPKYPYEKPPGVFRILILGDSWAEDMGSYYENLFSTRLEKRLNELYPSPRFEVINAGHYGFSHVQELMYYQKEGRKFHPDIVLVLYALDSPRGRYATLEDGVLRLHFQEFSRVQHFVRAVITWIRTHSHFGSFALTRLQQLDAPKRFVASLFRTRPRNASPKNPSQAKNAAQPKGPPRRTEESLGEPLAVFPSDHTKVANLPRRVKKKLIEKGVIRDAPGERTMMDWHIWSRFKQETEKDGGRLVIFQIWPDSVFRFPKGTPPLDIPAYNIKRDPLFRISLYEKALADGTYDPLIDSHRWEYGGNAELAEFLLNTLTEEGFLPPRPSGQNHNSSPPVGSEGNTR